MFDYLAAAAAAAAGLGLPAVADAAPPTPAAISAQRPALAYERYVLPNGLTVILHRSGSAPVVTVQMLYRVGSMDEPAGKHGFAHLFEHLMFSGSEHHDADYFHTLPGLGASDYNGMTTLDRTVYYETVPREALAAALFLESDRMAYLPKALTQAKLDKEVAVVLNEKRQSEDNPQAAVWQQVFTDLYAPGHPYRHSTIGEEADLRAATLDSVRDWFRRYYGAANATLVITGDIDLAATRAMVARYFAEAPAGPPVTRIVADSPPLAAPVRREVEAQVAAPRLYRTYVAPPMGGPDGPGLELAVQILGNGWASRLRHRLVDQLGLATSVTATFGEGLISSQMGLIVDAVSGEALERARREIDAGLAEFVRTGPTADELVRAKTSRRATLSRFLEGSFGRNYILTRGEFYTGRPDYYVGEHLALQDAATAETVRGAVARIVAHGYAETVVRPVPERRAAAATDRSGGVPAVGTVGDVPLPPIEEARLSNGVRLVVVRRPGSASANILAQFPLDPAAVDGSPALAAMTMGVLPRGAGTLDATGVIRRSEAIGADLQTSADRNAARVRLSILPDKLPDGLDLLSDVIERPAMAPSEFAQRRRQQAAALRDETSQMGAPGLRAMRRALYGDRHRDGARTRADELAAVEAADVADAVRWYGERIRPEGMTLFVTGPEPMERLRPLFEARFGRWRPSTPPPAVAAATAPAPAPAAAPRRVILIDRPGAQQAQIFAGRLIQPSGGPDDDAVAVANLVYGGDAAARIGSNLRGKRGWTYGIGSGPIDSRGPRMMLVAGAVQRDRTGDSVVELLREMRELGSTRPPDAAELARIAQTAARSAPVTLEGGTALLDALADSDLYGRRPDYAATVGSRYRAVTADAASRAARRIVDPEAMTWVIVGDADAVAPQIEAIASSTGLGPIERHKAEE